LRKNKAKLNVLTIADALLSIITTGLILTIVFDLYSRPVIITGQVAEVFIENKRATKSYSKYHYLVIKSNNSATELLVRDDIYNSASIGQNVTVELTPVFGLWNRVTLIDLNKNFQREEGINFWLFGIFISLYPIFNIKRWLELEWGFMLNATLLGKVIYFAVIINTIT
jgi:hypothetical protein